MKRLTHHEIIPTAKRSACEPTHRGRWIYPALLTGALVVLAVLCISPRMLRAQTATGSIVGTVTDTSGNLIVGANITVTDVATNETRVTKTDSSGAYTVTFLKPATYNISIASQGFQTFQQNGIILNVDAALTVNAKLPVGTVSQRVTVSGQPPLIEAQTSSIGQVMSTKTILDLPVNGRNSYAFVALVPGVIPSAGFSQTAVDEYNDQFISINGSRPNQNAFLLDGGVNTEPALSGPGFYPSIDLVQQYKVQTNNLSAQFHSTSGGVINVITKSGTNQFHGGVYEFLRNNYFDARDFFINRTNQPTPPYRFNQFGGTIGGPIYKNHTFFFFSYEGLRWTQSVTATATLPTQAERNGDFSALLPSTQLYNPFTTTPTPPNGYVRQPFVDNQIPTSMIDPVAATMLTYLPLPNQPGLYNNYIYGTSSPLDKNDYSIRIDQQLTQSSKLFGRYSISTTHQNRPSLYGTSDPKFALSSPDLGNDTLRQQQITIGDTTVLSPSFVMDLNSSFVRYHLTRVPPGQGMDITQLGFPSYFNQLPASSPTTFPSVIINGYGNGESIGNVGSGITFGAFGFVGILDDANQMYNEAVNFTKLWGDHTFTFGGDYGGGYFTSARFNNTAGFYIFGQDFTQGPSPFTPGGDAMASFMLGAGDSGFNYTGGPDEINSFRYWGGYFQDDWRATQKLTLNLGLRYDYESPWWERHNRITGFDPNATSPLQVPGMSTIKGGLTFPGTNGLSGYQFDPDYRTGIQPRVGFAYSLDPSTVIRGGYGIFMGPVYGSGYNNGEVPITGWQGQTNWITSLDGVTPYHTFSDPYPDGFVFPTGSSLGLATDLGQGVNGSIRNRKTSYAEQWNLDFQHQFPWQTLVSIAYAGSHGVHLYGDYNANQLPNQYLSMGSALQQQVPNPFFGNPLISPGGLSGPTVAQSQLLRPFPQFTGVTMSGASFYGASRYDSLQLKVERRFSNGFSILGSYTWSKLMDNVNATTTGFPGGNYSGGGIQDWDNLRSAWSPSVMDTPQYLAINAMWELPFGKGKRWLHNSTPAEYVLGGWQLNGIFTAISGSPLQVSMGSNTLFNYGGTQLPNLVPGQNPRRHGSIEDRLNQYFNAAAFSNPGAFTYGNAPRTIGNLLSPGLLNLDASVMKTFPISKVDFQLRFEGFNVFNHPQFGPPNTSWFPGAPGTTPTGQISFQQNAPRVLQVAGKINF